MMGRRTLFACLLFLGVFASVFPVMAVYNVWSPEDGVEIRQAEHLFWTRNGVAAREDGSYAVVWSSAEEQTQNVYLQEIDPLGNPLWPEDGLQVTSSPWAQDDAIVMPWHDGGWIVAWRDYRNGTDKFHPGEFYMQRVAPDGSLLWNPDGVWSGSGEWESESMFLQPAGDDGIFAIWSGWGGTWVQRFDETGSAQLDDPLQVFDDRCVGIVTDMEGGVFVFYNQYNTQPLVVKHVLSDGSLGWGQDGIVVISDPGDYEPDYVVTSDGLGGAFIAWSFHGYDGLDDIYGQHMDSEGSVLWSDMMTVLAGGAMSQHSPKLVAGEPGSFFMLYNEGANGYDDDAVVVQRVHSVDGAAQLAWGDGLRGVELATGEYLHTQYSSLVPDGSGGLAATWTSSYDNANPSHLMHVTTDGVIDWDSGPVHGYAMMCSGVSLLMRTSEVVLFSHENMPYQSTVTAYSYSLATGDPVGELTLAEGYDGDIGEPKIMRSGDNAYIAWSDRRLWDQGCLPYMQKLDVLTGIPQWQDQGIHLVPGFMEPSYDQTRFYSYGVEMVDDGFGNVIIGWHLQMHDDAPFAGYHGRLQKVNPDGELLWGNEGVAIQSVTGYEITIQKMISDNQGGTYLFLSTDGSLYMQHIDPDGQLLWADDGIPLVQDDNSAYLDDVFELDDGSMVLMYHSYVEQYHSKLFAMRLSTEGDPVWQEPAEVFDLQSPHHTVRHFEAARVGNRIAVGVQAADNGGGNRVILVQVIDEDGVCLWPEDPLVVSEDVYYSHGFSIAPAGNSEFWICWRADALQVNRFDQNKLPAFAEDLLLSGTDPIKVSPRLVADDAQGVFAFWTCGNEWQDTKLKFTHLKYDGSFPQPEYSLEGVYLNDTVHEKTEQYAISDGEGGVLTVWNDFRGRIGALEGDDVYAMRINETVTGVKDGDAVALQRGWQLAPAWPNPFNPSTRVSFTLAERADVRLAVYDVLGRQVATLVDRALPAGAHTAWWNGHDLGGSAAASGTYFIRLDTGGFTQTRRVVLLK